ncbi:uncharacterized protein BYT42DRAFT_551153 [Radiomyces spectabilis]|uniref:uncharacterized protein n=1 Tax=Radiomyces spectabilis TaxID=64574 RepID=UPI0022209D28|nr:uncharacterized protein BYT42DRAFT_551153 [Radiomyces spectabilis]KAI8393474.1 hypothetical protein BYT42DRAFT_551153 [Radiomyces spectabilis]
MSTPNSADHWQSKLTPQEKQVYADLFKKVDADDKGIVLKDEAMAFFKKSNVPMNILSEFWTAADNDNKGFLTDQEFAVALKLIACAQHGILTASPILSTTVSLPYFDGTTPAPSSVSTPRFNNRAPTSPMTSNAGETISPEDRNKYISFFHTANPVEGVLTADKARQMFLRSGLPLSTLENVWDLADTRKSGTLNQTEFIIAMHYIGQILKGNITSLPSSLPSHIYAAATGRMTTGYVKPQYTGTSPLMSHATGGGLGRQPSSLFTGEQSHNADRGVLDISPEELSTYKGYFARIATDNSGYISGADAVQFFRHSKLPESDLARIWDLADTNSTGRLNENEFAIAMHLINRRIAGGQIPNALPRPPGFQQQQPSSLAAIDLLGLSDNQAAESNSTPQWKDAGKSDLNHERSLLENTFATLQSEVQSESQRVTSLRSQHDAEAETVRELQEKIDQEKEKLAQWKRSAEKAEQELETQKKKKEELLRSLQTYRAETKFQKERAELAEKELEALKAENASLKKDSTSHDAGSDLFALSAVPDTGMFGKVHEEKDEGGFPPFSPSSSSAAGRPMSPSSTTSSKVSSNHKNYDPFAGFKTSRPSSPKVSLNHLKQESEAKQKRMSGSNVDISEIEAKFPDLSTMEESFTPTTPVKTSKDLPSASSSPSFAKASVTSPFAKHANPVSSPKPAFSATPTVSSTSPVTTKPTSTTARSKYGFDLSAFEGPSSSPNPSTSSYSIKDELSSIFGSPSEEPKPSTEKPNFNDVFNLSTPSQTPSQTQENQPKKNTSFDDIFF